MGKKEKMEKETKKPIQKQFWVITAPGTRKNRGGQDIPLTNLVKHLIVACQPKNLKIIGPHVFFRVYTKKQYKQIRSALSKVFGWRKLKIEKSVKETYEKLDATKVRASPT